MPQHGFARDSPFRVIDSTSHSARLVLESSAETLARYPFQFRLETEWRAEARGLSVSFTLTNTGDEPMPASLGWHPAFAWDSSPGWGVSFAEPERSPVRRVDANVRLLDEPDPYLTGARTLPLTEDLFDRGALIFAQAKDRAITYSSPAAAVFDLDFSDFPQFAVWKYPGAHFVCLEPWHGLPSPAGFTGDITSMPHQMSLSPGETRNFRCTLTLTAEACMPSASAIPCPRPSR
jgi:galactose mutarotase-like enzyme